MRLPRMVCAALDHTLSRFQPRLTAFKNQGCLALQHTDHINRVGLMHAGMTCLIDDVIAAIKFCSVRALMRSIALAAHRLAAD